MRQTIFHAALVAALAAGTGPALAMCVRPLPDPGEADPVRAEVKSHFDRSDAVLTGTVTGLAYVPARSEAKGHDVSAVREEFRDVKIAVDESWRGGTIHDITIRTAGFRLPDGRHLVDVHDFPFEAGKKYLVYAQRDGDHLRTSACTRTRPIDKAAADIAVLDTLNPR